jgi:hypothetical protein
MATGQVYKNVKIFAGGYDISGSSNKLVLAYAFDEVPMPAFGLPAKFALPGLPKLTYSLEGHADSAASPAGVEDVLFAGLAVADVPWLWCPVTGAAGETGYLAKAVGFSYEAGGALGAANDFTAAGVGANEKLIRGMMLENSQMTATGSGTARQLTAVSATQKLYAILHVLAVEGTNPTLDLIIQSDDASGFSSPVTRLTFTQKTAIGASFISVAGPITDDYFRASYTIGGTNSPKFTIAVAVGIL